jgi:hypothetical protein
MLSRITILWIVYSTVVGFVLGASLFSSTTPLRQSNVTPSVNGGAKNVVSEITAPNSADDKIADYTWWLAAFTCALVVVSAVQINFLIRTDETARISANAAQKSADLAERALVTSRRAWLSIDDFKIISPTELTEQGARIRVKFTVKNLGDTPATRFWFNATHWLHALGEPYMAARDQFIATMRKQVTIGLPGPP